MTLARLIVPALDMPFGSAQDINMRATGRILQHLVILLLSAVFLQAANPKHRIVYLPTSMSESWPTFTDAESGFQIKYPPSGWSRNQSVGLVTFSWGSSINVGVMRRSEADQKIIDRDARNLARFYQPTTTDVRIGETRATRIGPPKKYLHDGGNESGEVFEVQHGSARYSLSWSCDEKLSDEDAGRFESICQEMISTFRLIEPRHADYLSFTEPAYGFTIDYPYDWQLTSGGEPILRVRHGAILGIAIFATPKSTFASYRQRQGSQVTAVEERAEHFAHRLPGWRFRFLGSEAYAFERDTTLFVIWVEVSENPRLGIESRKPLDDILDSLRW